MLKNADRNRFAGTLKERNVVLCVTASISLYRVPDLVRDLRREGATVSVGMSREASELLSPKIMEWASGNPVITEITGNIEHITEFGGDPESTVLAVIPATHNIIGKFANGISDDVPSAFFSFAIGNGNRIVIAPAMHEGMFNNPANRRNVEFLKSWGVDIIPPHISEDKAKLSASDEILDHICRAFDGNNLAGKKVAVISGHTDEPIDPVRSVSNHGSGFTGYWISREFFRNGAAVTYIGNCTENLPSYVNYIHCTTSDDMQKYALEEIGKGCDVVLIPASISDYKVREKRKEKIKSGAEVGLTLEPRGKIIDEIRKTFSGVLIPFSLNGSIDVMKTREKFRNSNPEVIIANSYKAGRPFGTVSNTYSIITESEEKRLEDSSKPELAAAIVEEAVRYLRMGGKK